MELTLDLLQIESAINRLRTAQPPVGYVLPADVARLAEVYARMIYFKQARVEVATLPPDCQVLLARWAGGAASVNADRGSCEACQ